MQNWLNQNNLADIKRFDNRYQWWGKSFDLKYDFVCASWTVYVVLEMNENDKLANKIVRQSGTCL